MMKNRLSFQSILLLLAVLGFGSIPIITTDQYLLHAATMVLLYAYLASAWNIIGGFAGQLALGHAAYFGIGAYTSTLLFLQWQISSLDRASACGPGSRPVSVLCSDTLPSKSGGLISP